MKNRAITLVVMAAAIAVVACESDVAIITPTVDKTVTFKATMNAANEVPTNTSTGTGTFTGILDTSTNVFTYNFSFQGLTSGVNNGHIHGPADPGVNAGTTVNFNTLAGSTFSFGATSGTGTGSLTLVASTVVTSSINGDSLRKLLFAGKTYVNIHTINNTGGEIRGQLLKQ
jgi:hypothetical protein